jgi:hypothetical protein
MQDVAKEIRFDDKFYFSGLLQRHLKMASTSYGLEFSLVP